MKCPICFEGVHESWGPVHYGGLSSEDISYFLYEMKCPECKNDLLKFCSNKNNHETDEGFLIPLILKRKPLSEHIPKNYVKLYEESASVLPFSPGASAALSRTCLQLILRNYGKVTHGKLFDEIQQVIDSKVLSSELTQTLDIIRKNGNNATHPNKNENSKEIIQVDKDEAEWGLEILDSLFDHYITRPHIQKEKLDKFAQKHEKKDSVKK